jgi:hypothetical protein
MLNMKSRSSKAFVQFFFILFLIFSSTVYAQTWQWAHSGQGAFGASGGEGFGICDDPSGNVYITGGAAYPMSFGSSTFNASSGIYLIKIHNNGNVLWAKGPTDPDSIGGMGISVCSDANGNIYLTGYFLSPTLVFDSYTITNSGGLNPFLAKYDSNGNALWAKNGKGSTDEPWTAFCGNLVSADPVGNVICAGTFTSPSIIFGPYTLTSTGTSNVFLTKYNSNGSILWASNPSSGAGYATGVSTDSNGSIYLSGFFTSSTMVLGSYTLTNSGTRSPFLVKYDVNGSVIWARNSTGGGADYGICVSTDPSGNVYFGGGYTSSSVSFGGFTLNNPPNAFLVKYDPSGNVLWAKSTVGSYFAMAYSICTDANYIYASGRCGTSIAVDNFSLNINSNDDPLYIAKYDSNGNTIFASILSSGGDDACGICVDNNCNLFLSGDFIGSSFVLGTNTIVAQGNENPFAAKMTFTCQIDDVSNLSSDHPLVNVFPNPAIGSFTLQIDPRIGNGKLELINSLGQLVHEQKVRSGRNEITPSDVSVGVYTYNIFTDAGESIRGKLIVDRAIK